MTTSKYPGWIGEQTVLQLETLVDDAIVDYVASCEPNLSPEDLTQAADNIMASLYATIEAQLEIQINKAAYDSSIR